MSCVLILDFFFLRGVGGWGDGGGTVEEDSPCDYMFHKAEEKNEKKRRKKESKNVRERQESYSVLTNRRKVVTT